MATATYLSRIPGPPPMPFIGARGNLFMWLRDPVLTAMHLYTTYGELSSRVAGDLGQIVAIGPKYNHLLLSNTSLFHTIFEVLVPERAKERRRGMGLLNMNGEQHKLQRRLMMPAFHRKQVEGYRDTMARFTQDMLDQWQVRQHLDIAQEMSRLTLRIASQTLFGLDVADRAQQIGVLVKAFLHKNVFAPQVILFPFDLPGTPFRRMLQLNERLEDEILALIARKRATSAEQHDVLATLIHARDDDGSAMTDYELIGQAVTLLLAGHETSSNALTWTIFLLAQHPQVYADVVDELTSLLHGAVPTVEQINQLPLLDHVIKESLRLLPPAAIMSRVSTAPFEIGPYHAPKGAIVTISQYVTHRMPELYAEPQRFNPSRWETIDPSPYEYLPFGAGPRMCIGATFATMEIKIVLAMLLQRYRLALLSKTQVDHQVKITLSPKGGMPMVINPQDRQFTKIPVRGTIHKMVDLV
jgi:cytochrome P450